MIKIEYNNDSVSINDINTYLKLGNDDGSVDIVDINTYLKFESFYDSVSINDINTYLKLDNDDGDIRYIYQTYDQFHPEYKRIIELFNFGLGL